MFKINTRKFSQTPQNSQGIWEEELRPKSHRGSAIFRFIFKWGTITSLSALLYQNYKYSKQYDGIQSFAKTEKYYISPFFRFITFFSDSITKAYNFVKYPPLKHFLPDEPPFNKSLLRKTLVLNFEGTMYSKDMWSGEGLALHLRPGFRKMLKEMAQKYEIVVFSKEDMNFLSEVIKTIDPYQVYFPFYFGNEFLLNKSGKNFRDLKYLNRDPKRTVVIDFEQSSYLNANNNVVMMSKYKGEKEDREIKKLIFLLNHLSKPEMKDVRKEIHWLGGFNQSLQSYFNEVQSQYQKLKKGQSIFSIKGKQIQDQ